MEKKLMRVAVTGGAGQIAYSLLFRIASGELFGKDQPIALQILEVPEVLTQLEGVKMELEDSAFPLLKEITIGSDPYTIFGEVEWAILIGAKPRGPGMERKDLLLENGKIFVTQGKALSDSALKDAKVLVVGNPCNTNALITLDNARNLKKEHIFAMTALDQSRAEGFLASKANVGVSEVKNMTIWGNHSSTQVPDFYNAKIHSKSAAEVIGDEAWLKDVFIPKVQKRGAEIIKARGKSSAASAANSIIRTIQSIVYPSHPGDSFSLCIFSEGNEYGIDENLIFSFPCRSLGGGNIKIVSKMKMNPFLEEKIKLSEKELIEERELAFAKTI